MTATPPVDAARPVRAGEEIDAERLGSWLSERMGGIESRLTIEQFPGGFSNLTYLVRDAVGRELVLRRAPAGASVKGGHDMNREYRILARLVDAYPRVPRPLAACDDTSIIGAPFYIMERVRGVIPRGGRGLEARLDAALDNAVMQALSDALVDALVELHALDWRAAGLADLGHPEGYIERQVVGWTGRWKTARTSDVEAMDRVSAWLASHLSEVSQDSHDAAFIHNDFKLDNLVLDPADLTRIVAVLDWEMATVGNPLLDLGTSLAYWLDPDDPPILRMLGVGSLTTRPGAPRRSEVLERYARLTRRDVGNGVWIFAFGLFKLAVILQQIHARWAKGLTKDPRFATLDQAVAACATVAAEAIARGRIDRLG